MTCFSYFDESIDWCPFHLSPKSQCKSAGVYLRSTKGNMVLSIQTEQLTDS